MRRFPSLVLRNAIKHFTLLGLGGHHNRRNKLLNETLIVLRSKQLLPHQLRPFAMEQIDHQALDMRAIRILIRHDHHLAIAQLLHRFLIVIFPAVLQTQNLLEIVDLGVLVDLSTRRIAHVEQFTLEREDAIESVTAGQLGDAGHCQRLGRQSLSHDQRAVRRSTRAGIECVINLGRQVQLTFTFAVGLFRSLIQFEIELLLHERLQLVHQSFIDILGQHTFRAKRRRFGGQHLFRLR
mmetsp:Transcript_1640/g.3182  ORF Transcript_1640/g.3182 Transcript_1640/m.3182 type:complete len:238 (-) Transcript_1640:1226-1939(-)